jgi:hypothetical protein
MVRKRSDVQRSELLAFSDTLTLDEPTSGPFSQSFGDTGTG